MYTIVGDDDSGRIPAVGGGDSDSSNPNVKSSTIVVGLRDRVAIIRTLILSCGCVHIVQRSMGLYFLRFGFWVFPEFWVLG